MPFHVRESVVANVDCVLVHDAVQNDELAQKRRCTSCELGSSAWASLGVSAPYSQARLSQLRCDTIAT
ncbi:unnamed protein product [Sphagnum jensenii]|uniref:Uncharacterized protein n=1 Tax=Sphagnum jensenii TaxID=128206 RepID=A0ABP1B3R2_9BRYO